MAETMSQFRRSGPVQKMVATNQNFGNRNITEQQSTSRQFYHALPLDGRLLFNFFEGVSTVAGNIVLTNIPQNKLQVQESVVIRRLYFCVLLFDEMSGAFTGITDMTTAGVPEFYGGAYSIVFDTTTVQKPNPVASQLPSFSKNSNHTTNEWIWMDNNSTIIPDVEFFFPLQVPVYTPVENAYLRLTVEGIGTLFSPKSQF